MIARRIGGLAVAAAAVVSAAGTMTISPATASASPAPHASSVSSLVTSVTTRQIGGVTETIVHYRAGVHAIPSTIGIGPCNLDESMIEFGSDTPSGGFFTTCYDGHGTVTPNPALQNVESVITGDPSSGSYTHGRTGFTGCPSTQSWTGFISLMYSPEASVCRVTLN